MRHEFLFALDNESSFEYSEASSSSLRQYFARVERGAASQGRGFATGLRRLILQPRGLMLGVQGSSDATFWQSFGRGGTAPFRRGASRPYCRARFRGLFLNASDRYWTRDLWRRLPCYQSPSMCWAPRLTDDGNPAGGEHDGLRARFHQPNDVHSTYGGHCHDDEELACKFKARKRPRRLRLPRWRQSMRTGTIR